MGVFWIVVVEKGVCGGVDFDDGFVGVYVMDEVLYVFIGLFVEMGEDDDEVSLGQFVQVWCVDLVYGVDFVSFWIG